MEIRNEIINAIIKEIVGPDPNPNYKDEDSNEEILLASVHGSPNSRYGAGMLYPQQEINYGEIDTTGESQVDKDEINISLIEQEKKEEFKNIDISLSGEGADEEPVGMANQFLPSAMGFTIRFRRHENNDNIKLNIQSAYYEKGKNKRQKKRVDNDGIIHNSINKKNEPIESDYWIRRPISIEPIELNLFSIFKKGGKSYNRVLKRNQNDENWLTLRIYNRSSEEDENEGYATYTFVLINEIKSDTNDSKNTVNILYQNELTLTASNPNLIAPYKEKVLLSDTAEEKQLNLLYRKKRIYSIGHGASVIWKQDNNGFVTEIKTSVIPVYDLPQVSPTAHVTLSMLELSDLGDWTKAKNSLHELRHQYKTWIEKIECQINNDELKHYREAALKNIQKCKDSLSRISRGIDQLTQSQEDSDLVKCFRWMNRAMIWQQQRSKAKIRKWKKSGNTRNKILTLEYLNETTESHTFESLQQFHNGKYNGKWRPFQLAFVLMNIDSIVNPESEDRKIVDLIWFPTGGGKTEAYLGLTAFNIFYRRIQGKINNDWKHYGGTAVIMRYTLRLLTTQQYERAASLICACDLIRRENKRQKEENLEFGELGDEPISIGLWVGGTSTPNMISDARIQLNKLTRDPKEEYNFVVLKCPCCGTQIGKVDGVTNYDKLSKIKGLHKRDGNNGEVYFQCENKSCEYSNNELPLQVVDESIYSNPPTLLLGTVDKFAMIPWKEEAGNLFGFRKKDRNNIHRIKPPELIIQDELHLIAGPLGTMVGLYETMVQTLCNNYRKIKPPFITEKNDKFVPPKIVASSATISRSFEQVKNLYAINSRSELNIFPAQGLDFGDTWFSEEKSLDEKDDHDRQKFPGRKYVGILASGYPSPQTAIVRAYSSVLQKIRDLSATYNDKTINYYWTLLGYFNSIRELGGASSLVYGDIGERLRQIQSRDLIIPIQRRYIRQVEELTSRISSSEIPVILKKLESSYSSGKNLSLDICLATNMVATGVDISRLGLMFIHGQPKTTSEYIQASSRVGRDIPDGPGLIFTLYSSSKPRDKSHYEQFQGYHSRIYSNVEPTSVTPFSINAREKGLHAIFISLLRHFSKSELSHSPAINDEFEQLYQIISNIIIKRCEKIEPDEVNNTKLLLSKRIKSWRNAAPDNYGDAGNYAILQNEGYFPLMYSSSAEVRKEAKERTVPFATPTSMRGVDTESVIEIFHEIGQNEQTK